MRKIFKLFTLFIVTSLLFCGCLVDSAFFDRKASNKKPDDEFSRAVREAIGEDLYYFWREETDNYVYYEYLIKEKDFETISGFADAINGSLNDEQGKVAVAVYIEFPGGEEPLFNLRNFSDESLETADYDGFYSLKIYNPDVSNDPFFSNPSTYTVIKGIKKLEISQQMRQRAEEEGIDWYACWPELEEMIVME